MITHARMTPRERMAICLELMRADEFERGKTPKALAKQHGETLAVWKRAAAEASNHIRLELPVGEFKRLAENTLADIVSEARKAGQFGSAVAGVKLQLENRNALGDKAAADSTAPVNLHELRELIDRLGFELVPKGQHGPANDNRTDEAEEDRPEAE